ncbi:MAG: hypothetical protein Q4G48_05760, partial [Bacteroidia bacterium]|nr:hypothetical protein [Bacteroidia bacterium]
LTKTTLRASREAVAMGISARQIRCFITIFFRPRQGQTTIAAGATCGYLIAVTPNTNGVERYRNLSRLAPLQKANAH